MSAIKHSSDTISKWTRRLRAESPFGAQNRMVQVRSDDWERSEGGAASPLPFALAEVGRDEE
jgi:hypothetical protein